MDSSNSKVKPSHNPRKDANIFSILFFYWITPLLNKGSKKELEQQDLFEALDHDHSDVLGSRLEKEWMRELEKRRISTNKLKNDAKSDSSSPMLRNAFIRTFITSLVFPGIICFIEECVVRLLQPWFMGQFMSYFIHGSETTDTTFLMACFYAGGVVLMSACYNITHHLYFFTVLMIGMRARIAAGSVIYRKALRLSCESVSKYTTGKIVNLLSNDANRFDNSALFIHYLWVGPLQFLIVLYLTWERLGEVTLAGAAIILIFVPLQGWVSKQFFILRGKTAKQTDERLGSMNELINGIKVVKMYAWEQSFSDLIEKVRKREVRVIQKAFWFRAINYASFLLFLRIALALILLVWVFQQKIVTPEIAFLTLSWYNVTKLSLVNFFPAALTNIAETLKTISRVEEFLLLDEFHETRILNKNKVVNDNNLNVKDYKTTSQASYFISARNLSAKWDFESNMDTIKDVAMEIKRGQCFGICGSVGEGKSSLLQCFLGELPSYAGEIEISGRLTYASQDPWVFEGTIRQNILFGGEYDPKRYNETIKMCRMTQDIASFEYGSNEIVGDRGTTLSGGQKARLNLARCIYRDSDIYLLDDPLSAVDSNVGKDLFEKCIRGHLRRKVVVLVTHQLHFLKNVDHIIVLHQGKIVESGTFNELMAIDGGKLSMLMKESPEAVIEHDIEKTNKDFLTVSRTSSLSSRRQSLRRLSITEDNTELYEEDASEESVTSDFRRKEVSKTGSVNIQLYWKYVKAGASPLGIATIVISTLMGHGLFRFADAWLGIWTSREVLTTMNNLSLHLDSKIIAHSYPEDKVSSALVEFNDINYFYLTVYCSAVFGMSFSLLLLIRRFFVMCTNASKRLHNQMFGRILCAPSKFFNDNPKGRILNRFSKDIGCMDDLLPQVKTDVYEIFMRIVGIIAVVTYKIWWMIFPTIVLILVFYIIRRYYLKSSVAIKRIEGASKSPIISQLASSLNGLSTIRSCEASQDLIKEFDELQDLHTSAWYCFISTSRFLAVCCDWIVFVYLCLCTFPFLILGQENVEVSDVGLVISTALALTGMLQYGMRQSAEMENLMTSVERVLEYSEIKTEEESEGEHKLKGNNSPIENLPKQGVIEFKNVFLQYSSEGRYVLQNVNFKTGKEEKLGVVGRTGAGKSSLVAALFRLVESDGDILIDGHSIKEKKLSDLRKSIAIIPQDPVLFTGSLRMNLDPFSSYTDEEIWEALNLSNLFGFVSSLPKGLQHSFTEGGDNLSVGQRQLMCLARALLRKTKILVLDEATANVDLETDEFIQQVIRKEFSHCTVLTIAHRLNTIIDYDKILVLQNGKVIEYDSPESLMRDDKTSFHSMLKDAGIVVSSKL